MCFLKHDWSFSRKKNEFPLGKDVFTKFNLNWLSGSGEGRVFYKINHQIIVLNLLSSPLLKGCDPSFERS